MAREIFVVVDVLEISTHYIAIGLNTKNEKLREKWRAMSMHDLRSIFIGKEIQIVATDLRYSTKILDVNVTNSIADYKNVFLKLDKNSLSSRVKINDEVEIDF